MCCQVLSQPVLSRHVSSGPATHESSRQSIASGFISTTICYVGTYVCLSVWMDGCMYVCIIPLSILLGYDHHLFQGFSFKLFYFRVSASGRNLDSSELPIEVVISPLCHEAESSEVLCIRQKRLHIDSDRISSKYIDNYSSNQPKLDE